MKTLYAVSLLTLDIDKIFLYNIWNIILSIDELLKKFYNFIKLLFIYLSA